MLVLDPNTVNGWKFCGHNTRLLKFIDHINDTRRLTWFFAATLKYKQCYSSFRKKGSLDSEVK